MTKPPDPHPRTGVPFASPVPPGSGWPGGGLAVADAEKDAAATDLAGPATRRARSAAGVARLAAGASSLELLDARLTVCRACPRLVAWREEVATTGRRAAYRGEPYWGRPVAGFGDPRPQALVVGLAPAAHGANRTGRVFTGDRSGDWLYAALHRCGLASQPESTDAADGLELRGIRVAAAVRCAPPGNAPTPVERDACSPWLEREIALIDETLGSVLALGGFGWDATLTVAARLGWVVPRPRPRFGHGVQAELVRPDGRAVRLVGCYHVSQQNTFTGRLTEPMLDAAIRQLGVAPRF